MDNDISHIMKQKDAAYWERNQLVAALSKIFPAHLAKHPDSDENWEDDWRTIVVVYVPAHTITDIGTTVAKIFNEYYYQLTWHIHDFDVPMFDHLSYQPILTDQMIEDRKREFCWDGHTTEEKYHRLRGLKAMGVVTWPKPNTGFDIAQEN